MYIRLRPIMKVSTSNWPPQEIFSPDQVTVTDVPGDGNCMFYSLFRGDTNLENVTMVRKRLMDELISMRYEECTESSYTWEFWTMSSIADRNNEVGMNGWIHTESFEEYTEGMLEATPYSPSTRWGGDHELLLYASIFQKNVAVYHLINGRYKKIFENPFWKKIIGIFR